MSRWLRNFYKLGLVFTVFITVLLLPYKAWMEPVVIAAQNTSPFVSTAALNDRVDRLARGTNLSNWFWAPNKTYSSSDFSTLHRMGMTYVRLPIDFSYLYDPKTRNKLNRQNLANVYSAIQAIQHEKLAVLVDIHATPQPLSNSSFQPIFKRFWQSFAAYLSTNTDPDYTFLQPLNEPIFEQNPQAWLPIQAELIRAIRRRAPKHTIIATGAKWQNRETLIQMQPLSDRNIIYDFHFYDPFLFTHQGADWVGGYYSQIQNLPYPSSPQLVQSVIDQLAGNPEAQGAIAYYGNEHWSKAEIQALLAPVANWANRNRVKVICSEFGAYGVYAPADSRVQYITDVRSSFEQLGIGWAMWEYMSGYGFAEQSDSLIVDRSLVQALGLKLPLSMAETKIIQGTNLANLLVGDARNNTINGRGGNDILNGVGKTSGKGTIDTLIGEAGGDRFVLGNHIAFYNDGNDRRSGTSDYGIIQDFNASEDKIQLFGSSDRYFLRPVTENQQSMRIYLDTNHNHQFNFEDELIGVVQSDRPIDLTDDCFIYVQ